MGYSLEVEQEAFVSIQEAVQKLRSGQLVAIPTETVYGLAACIHHESALRKIFETKQRPFFDPLIVHVGSIEQARFCVHEWSELAETLAKKFWPGPLTLVLKKNKRVSSLITSGLETVALRWPRHKSTQELLEHVEMPVAAPSANRFGKTSPTKALDVVQEFLGEVFVLDGGDCEVGIESTLLDISEGPSHLKVLRPGMISADHIESALVKNFSGVKISEVASGVQAPGQMENHYMPEKPLVIVESCEILQRPDFIQKVNSKLKTQFKGFIELNLPDSAEQAARRLYASFREASCEENSFIVYVDSPQRNLRNWWPLKNRILRAQSLTFKSPSE